VGPSSLTGRVVDPQIRGMDLVSKCLFTKTTRPERPAMLANDDY
jgi:hypothetical protein